MSSFITVQDISLHLQNSNLEGLKTSLDQLTVLSSLELLGRKSHIKSLGKTRNIDFVKELFNYIELRNTKEQTDYPNQHDKVSVTSSLHTKDLVYSVEFVAASPFEFKKFKKSKLDKISEFRGKFFKAVVDSIEKDNIDVVPVLMEININKRSLDSLARKSASFHGMNIISETINNFYYLKKSEFFKTLINYSDTNLLMDKLWEKHRRIIKISAESLQKKDEIFLEARMGRILHNDFKKLLWLEEKFIGLKSIEYKGLGLWLSNMNSDELNQYINLDKKTLIPIIEKKLLDERSENYWNWKMPGTDTKRHQLFSSWFLQYKLDNELPEKSMSRGIKI